jgi:hypothetical protein
MRDGQPFIEIRLCFSQPAELLDLVDLFAAISSQFERYMKSNYPDLDQHAKLYVRHIREGSIIIELVPIMQTIIGTMDYTLIVDNFVQRYKDALHTYLSGGKKESTRQEIRDYLGSVRAIARDTDGKAVISSAEYKETKTSKRVSFEFTTDQAREARNTLEAQNVQIELPALEVHNRVLMRFYQQNIAEPKIGSRKTGEKGIIESISLKPLSIIYETELAKERIYYEKKEDEHNIFHKGFYVDCYVERVNGKPVAYRIFDVHEIIDLPEDIENG